MYDLFTDGAVAGGGIESDGFYRPRPRPPEKPPERPAHPPLVPPLEPPRADAVKKCEKEKNTLFGGLATDDLLLVAVVLLVLSREGFDNIELLIGVGVLVFAMFGMRGSGGGKQDCAQK